MLEAAKGLGERWLSAQIQTLSNAKWMSNLTFRGLSLSESQFLHRPYENNRITSQFYFCLYLFLELIASEELSTVPGLR